MVVKANADVIPRGVVYTLRSVLRGLIMSSLAHFTGVLYSPAWVFTLSVYHHRFPKTSNSKRAEVKHPRFFLCSHHYTLNPFALGACGKITCND